MHKTGKSNKIATGFTYNETILRELGVLPGFIIGRYNLNKIHEWHSVHGRFVMKSERILRPVNKGKQEERNNY